MLAEFSFLLLGLLALIVLVYVLASLGRLCLILHDLKLEILQIQNDLDRIESNVDTIAEATTYEINSLRERADDLEQGS
jgi:uncharacterized membrane protein